MNHIVLRWLPAILILLLPQLALSAKKWDREAAIEAFSEARELQTALLKQESPLPGDFLRCIRTYQRVYRSDPHFGASDDAVFEAGRLYLDAARRFKNESFGKSGGRLLQFLISDYPKSRHCKTAQQLLSESLRQDEADDVRQRALSKATKDPKDPLRHRPVSLRSVRYWTNEGHTRVTIDLDNPARFVPGTLSDPNRIFIDIENAQAIPNLRETIPVNDGKLHQIRIGQNLPDLLRVVLDLAGAHDFSFRELHDPYRIVIDLQSAQRFAASEGVLPKESVDPRSSIRNAGSGNPIRPRPAVSSGKGKLAGPKGAVPSEPATSVGTRVSIDDRKPTHAIVAATSPSGLAENPVAALDPPEPELQPKPAALTSRGDRTLTRVLGLKIQRIVIDPGHGGHDTGTIGPSGLIEKELVLRVAKQLKQLLVDRLGAEVVLTRTTDSYLSLEQRTALANKHRADLFLSLHANSSRHRSISGVETYYLDFASTDEAKEVAARENSMTNRNIRDLQDIVKSIATADKSAESREFARIIQRNLFTKSKQINPKTRNRGVRSAPFVVLIGARMPSVLAELGFVSNPKDEKLLKTGSSQGKLAEALFSGIESYMETLGSYVAQSQTNP